MTYKVDIVVVNWNAGDQLRDCIASIIDHALDVVGKIVIVDNGSTDESLTDLPVCEKMLIIRSSENLGFGKACNRGALNCGNDFVLFLNPDAMLFAGTLQSALAFLSGGENRKVGLCGVRMVGCDGQTQRSCARFPSMTSFLAHSLGLDRIFPRIGYAMTDWNHSTTRSVDHVIGAFYLVRRSVFQQLKGFDERFFVYLEDLDFSLRATQAGWKVFFLSEVSAFHAGGGTSDQIKARRLYYSLQSRILYVFKHFTLFGAVLVTIFTLVFELFMRSLQALINLSLTKLKETWAGYSLLFLWCKQRVFQKHD